MAAASMCRTSSTTTRSTEYFQTTRAFANTWDGRAFRRAPSPYPAGPLAWSRGALPRNLAKESGRGARREGVRSRGLAQRKRCSTRRRRKGEGADAAAPSRSFPLLLAPSHPRSSPRLRRRRRRHAYDGQRLGNFCIVPARRLRGQEPGRARTPSPPLAWQARFSCAQDPCRK
jgi:hypothetical protein